MKMQGYTLVTLLILLTTLSILAISAINNSLLQTKMADNFFMGFKELQDTERVLRRAESAIARFERWHCYLKTVPADYVLKIKSKNGLATLNACQIILSENRRGYYVIQSIPDERSDVCMDGEQIDSVSYYRVTAWTGIEMEANRASKGEGVLLQTTYAKLHGKRVQKKCEQFPYIHESMRVSWRLLT